MSLKITNLGENIKAIINPLLLRLMQVRKQFMHPIHMVHYMQAILKRAVRESRAIQPKTKPVPCLFSEISYYFTMEFIPMEKENKAIIAVCFFSCDGEIIFIKNITLYTSLWSFRRLGAARKIACIEGHIRSLFRQNGTPLHHNDPFQRVEKGLYWANINWMEYKSQFKS